MSQVPGIFLRIGATALLALSAAVHVPASESISQTPPDPVVEIQEVEPWDVYLFMERYCAECHGGHLKKPKGQFGYILDLPRLVDEAYIIPGAPDESDVFTSLVTDDPDFKMPPDDSEGPKPGEDEIARIHDWIMAGAVVRPKEIVADSAAEEVIVAAPVEEITPQPTVMRVFGRLHPLVVHFPIALLICGAGATLFARMRGREDWLHGMVRGCLWIGAIGAVIAAATGWTNARLEGFSGGEVETHRWLGVATAVVGVAAVVACEFLSRINATRWHGGRTLQVVLLIGAAILAAAAGHTGGLLAFGADYFWGF